jgi:4'-phosphopantetheinyl transferase EntD
VSHRGLVSRILAPGCFGADLDDVGQDIPLHPQEAAYVGSAAPKRQRDFLLGRACARAALLQVGLAEQAIPMETDGAPVWPQGLVGSITHTRGYAAALVAPDDRFLAAGIDAERIGGVTEALMPRLFGAAERDWLMALEAEKRAAALTVFFSAKEAFYKAFSSRTASLLVFRDIHIDLQDDGFVARHGDRVARGRWAVQGDLAVTALTVAAS